ncbi:MAG TPA: TetR/AcrR family transcriptional regulator [Polyangiales bacterium]|nr:TetR/AcrR family transcriptional regulator [Polyangiales bacterium]
MPRTAKPKPRRRLEADAARELILDATEQRLVEAGPSGIRLQEVAADAGLSHSTVLHHFGSRELLVKAVITRSTETINARLIEAIQASSGDDTQLETIFENVAEALERTGNARVVLWLALEGHPVKDGKVRLSDVVDAAHALRLTRKKHAKKPAREDTARTVVLATLALVGSSVLAPTLLADAGLPADARAGAEFRKWLARLLIAHLDG